MPERGTRPDRGTWLSVKDAARQLELSRKTVERRALKGKLRSRVVDGELQVCLLDAVEPESPRSAEAVDLRPPPDQVPDSGHVQAERSLVLVHRMAQLVGSQMSPLLAELRSLQERNEALSRENGQLTERLRALERQAQESIEQTESSPVRVPEDIERTQALAERLRRAAGEAATSDPSVEPAVSEPRDETRVAPEPSMDQEPARKLRPWWQFWRAR